MTDPDSPHVLNNELTHYDDFLPEHTIPEHALLIATLERAILDYLNCGYVQQKDRRSARKFFRSNGRHPYGFWYISMHIAQDPKGFRINLLRLLNAAKSNKSLLMGMKFKYSGINRRN
jgi:hypothetical protein